MYDGDLGIFGLWPDRYDEYREAIKEEWIGTGVISEELFTKGRLEFLLRLQACHHGRPFYFGLHSFHNKMADENLSREIESLKKHILKSSQ
jgi:predicted metal-dependent HD superfamily phosphohydrolase